MFRIIVVIVIITVLAYIGVWNLTDTTPPKEWGSIRIGMTRHEVDMIICGLDYHALTAEALDNMGFPKQYDAMESRYNKWRSKYAWYVHVEFDNGGYPPKGGWGKSPIERQNDKVINVKIYTVQEGWFQVFPYPFIYQTYHS